MLFLSSRAAAAKLEQIMYLKEHALASSPRFFLAKKRYELENKFTIFLLSKTVSATVHGKGGRYQVEKQKSDQINVNYMCHQQLTFKDELLIKT